MNNKHKAKIWRRAVSSQIFTDPKGGTWGKVRFPHDRD